MVDMHYIYIKLHGVKTNDWYTGSYRMVHAYMEEIIKECPKECRTPDINLTESNEDGGKQKAKGKATTGEKKEKEK